MSGTADRSAQLDAAHQAEVCNQYRDWHRYLSAHKTLLAAQTADIEDGPRFEQSSDGWDAKRTQAETDLKRLPSKRRTLFDSVREQRRQEVYGELEQAQRETQNGSHAPVLDSHAVDLRTIEGLLDDAEGRGAHAPDGLVPWTHGRWYQVDLESVRGAPTTADYAADSLESVDKRKRLSLVAVLLVALVLGVWWTWPRSNGTDGAATSRVRVNGIASLLWTPRELLITDGRGTVHTQLVTATTDLRQSRSGTGAFWLRDRLRPLTLCVPDGLQESATSIRVRSGGDVPERVYGLHDAADAPTSTTPDLLLLPCGNPEASRLGILTATQPITDAAIGAPVDLGDGHTLTVTSMAVQGPGQDRTIPAGQVRILVHVQAPATVDWSRLAPTLLTTGGTSFLPAETTVKDGESTFVYVAPSWQVPSGVAWIVSPPTALSSIRWRMTLDPPLSRLALLRAALDITAIEAKPLPGGDGLELRLSLHNRSGTALQLDESDLAAIQNSRSLAFAPFETLRTPLRADDTRSLTVVLPSWNVTSGDLELTVGAERFRLRSQTLSTAVP